MRISIRQRKPGAVLPPVRKGTIRIRVIRKGPLAARRPAGSPRVAVRKP